MASIAESTVPDIDDIIKNITSRGRTTRDLPGGGFLLLEHDLPFLVLYNKDAGDENTLNLVRTKASYLIMSQENKAFYQKFCCELANVMSDKFGSFLYLEIYRGPLGDEKFVVIGNAKDYPVTLNVLKNQLLKIDRKQGDVHLSVHVENHEPGCESMLDVREIEQNGAQFLQVQVPPVYENHKGEQFPVYFRRFKSAFNKALRKALFEYARVQTSCNIMSYTALGKRKIDQRSFKIDQKLFDIQSGYQFLLLVAPTNIQQIRQAFFDSDFTEVKDYHYRLLTIDPDILKRDLFNLKLETINDPAISYLFNEKRDEIDQELSMLKERGSRNFMFRSFRLYGGLQASLVEEAKLILDKIDEKEEGTGSLINAKEFAALAEEEFEYFRSQSSDFKSKIHIKKDLNVIMVSKGELYIPADYEMNREEADALIQHEIGTHVLTYFNGNQQPLHQMAIGLADYDPLQEGIAVLSEYMIGALSGNRLRILAARVLAGSALMNGMNFKQVFHMLFHDYRLSKERAFNVTVRIFQGGGFLKDIIYLKGLVDLREYLMNGGDLKALLAGKYGIKHAGIIKELTNRGILKPAVLRPRYMQIPEYEKRLKAIRDGLPIYKMKQL